MSAYFDLVDWDDEEVDWLEARDNGGLGDSAVNEPVEEAA